MLFACILLSVLCPLLPAPPLHASVLHDFRSDGCTLFPDGSIRDRQKWCDCCFIHDIAYWRGGTEKERKQADLALKDCVRERTGSRLIASLIFMGVRAGGHPVFPTWYRWGFGWKYGRGYTPLSDRDRTMAEKKLAEYYKSHPGGYCVETKPGRTNRPAVP